MGTRGAFGVRIDGEDKITYNHFDSYPDGLGNDIVDQLDKMLRRKGFDIAAKARAVRFVKDGEKPTAAEKEAFAKFTNKGVSEKGEDWYSVLRELQGRLDLILGEGVMIDSRKFMNDSLLCEYAYVANLDTDSFEVYRGFQKTKGAGRYAEAATAPDRDYWPVTLVAEFPLRKIPKDWADCLKEEDEDE